MQIVKLTVQDEHIHSFVVVVQCLRNLELKLMDQRRALWYKESFGVLICTKLRNIRLE